MIRHSAHLGPAGALRGLAPIEVAPPCSVPAPRTSGQLVSPARPKLAGASGDGLRGGGPRQGGPLIAAPPGAAALWPSLRASSAGRWLLSQRRRGASVGSAVAMAVYEVLPTWVTLDEQLPVVDGAVVGTAQGNEVLQGMVATA